MPSLSPVVTTPPKHVVIFNLARMAAIGKASLACGSRLNVAAIMICLAVTGRSALGDDHPVQKADHQGVVFVLNGAGSQQATSAALESVVAESGLRLTVVPVCWSHGFGGALADQTDWGHAQKEGYRLASRIASHRQTFPDRPIFVVAHSAGSGVALTAAAAVPPGSLSRVILLAPSVSAGYDLRPALRGTRDGMDVFYSRRDVFALGLGMAIVGPLDGCRGCPAAGRVGFQVLEETPADAGLYAKLRQHPWQRWQARCGNRGFHSGAHRPRFLTTFVVPLLNPDHSAEGVKIVRD